MGKTKNNISNLETLCLDCGRRSFSKSLINDKGYYEIYEDNCISCKRITKHIKCKSLEKLKSKLEFCDREYGINNIVLNALNINKEKQKII